MVQQPSVVHVEYAQDTLQRDGIVVPVQGRGMRLNAQGIQAYEGSVVPVQGRGMQVHAHSMREHEVSVVHAQGREVSFQSTSGSGTPVCS